MFESPTTIRRSLRFLVLCIFSFLQLKLAFLATGVISPKHVVVSSSLTRLWSFSSRKKHVRSTADDFISQELSSNDMSHVTVHANLFSSMNTSSNSWFGAEAESDPFSAIFRHSAPYIAMHRGTIIVVHIPGSTLKNRRVFESIMDDISILHLLGVKIVLVVGVRDQLDERILSAGGNSLYHSGMRITDEKAIKFLKEESGTARFEIESVLSKGFRGTTTPSGINVVSGNLFYSAKPLGVRNGIDFQLTGEVRRIEVENFQRRLDSGDIVLLTSLGYSTSGEVYNVPSESLAAECAARLKAAKILYFTEGEGLLDTRNDKTIQSLRLSQANALLNRWGIDKALYNYVEEDDCSNNKNNNGNLGTNASNEGPVVGTGGVSGRDQKRNYIFNNNSNTVAPLFTQATTTMTTTQDGSSVVTGTVNGQAPTGIAAYVRLIARCVYALTGGVKRAHLIASHGGSILRELYTRDGAGMLISRDMYEGMRPATEADLRSILEIIRPLEYEGILVHRTLEQLRQEIPTCFVMTRDEKGILACGMLKPYSATHAEIACIAVHPKFRKEGRGELLLAYLERRAVLMGLTHLFLLSTRTMQWFEERGFTLADPSVLTALNRDYNKARGSKVYMKVLGSQRDVEAEELLWNIT